MARYAPLIFFACAAACDRQQIVLFDRPGDQIASRLEIRPTSARIHAGEEAMFRAFGTFADGERDVTGEAKWTLEDETLATIDQGRLISRIDRGGATAIHAVLGGLDARAELTVLLETSMIDPSAPRDAEDYFENDPVGDDVRDPRPLIIYPSDQTMFPINIVGTHLQWRAPMDQDLFEIRFDSSIATIRYYTRERSLLFDDRLNEQVARTHAGRSVSIVVRSVSTRAATIHRSTPVTVHYSREAVTGSLYYWSTGAAAIMRAAIDARSAEKFFPDEGDDACGSCHTVSRNGRRIAFGYNGEKLRIAGIPDRTTLYPETGAQPADYGWGTFSPSAEELLVASKGKLTLFDVAANNSRMIALPAGVFATHPDWSPDDQQIAVVITDAAPGNKDVKGSSLGRLLIGADHTFGAIETIVANTGPDDTIAFPSHSPDGRFIAFVRTTGKSKDSKPAELYVVRADGSEPPILLERLNRRVRNEDAIRMIGNSMPTWAPSTGPGIGFIAFSSIRDYGDILVDTDRDQLWAAAIDLDLLSGGVDSSYAAFWLPFQALDEGNHRAFWSLNPDDACPSTFELCDGFDNDCNGVIDDACCTPSGEMCGDMIDNDCDGAIDEGCGCDVSESCSNNIDDDCDQLIDLLDEDCSL